MWTYNSTYKLLIFSQLQSQSKVGFHPNKKNIQQQRRALFSSAENDPSSKNRFPEPPPSKVNPPEIRPYDQGLLTIGSSKLQDIIRVGLRFCWRQLRLAGELRLSIQCRGVGVRSYLYTHNLYCIYGTYKHISVWFQEVYKVHMVYMMALYDCILCTYIYILHPNVNQHEPIRMTARFVAFLYSADIIWPSSLRWTKSCTGCYWRVRPRKLTCPLKRCRFKRKVVLQPLLLRGHVSFRRISILKWGFLHLMVQNFFHQAFWVSFHHPCRRF